MSKIIYTPGTWDLFHIGHLNLLKRAAQLGEQLIVGVSTDELVTSYKGKQPAICFEHRREIISSLRCVDGIVVQEKLLDVHQLASIHFNILVLGSDWENSNEPGILWAVKHKKILFLQRTPEVSTTDIKNSIIGKNKNSV